MKTFAYNIFIKTTAEKLWDALTNAEFNGSIGAASHCFSDWKLRIAGFAYQRQRRRKWKGEVYSLSITTDAYSFDLSVDQDFRENPFRK